jgi:hypothetical protein
LAIVALLTSLGAEQAIDKNIEARIREEAAERSQIMRTVHVLTDVYGPRLTGSPAAKAAGEWAIKTMEGWGFTNGHLEAWDFGHPGWANERLSAHLVSPVRSPLIGEALAWTPGTSGPVTAQAYQLILPDRPTGSQLEESLNRVKEHVRGKIVLVGKAVFVPVDLSQPTRRRDDQAARALYDPNDPGASSPPQPPSQRPRPPMTARQISAQVNAFLVANGAKVRVNDAGRPHGQIAAYGNPGFDVAKAVPTVVIRNEDYGRISRLLADGTPVTLEFDIVNRLYPEGKTAYNAIAEIPGSDKQDEIVMLGGHLDSWHAATGATDNAIGCATMMEAARILKAIGVTPRRTIRVALWSGEEQGLLGSAAYVREHFGTFERPKPRFHKLDVYLNMDAGTGRIRGARVFGPSEATAVIRDALAPFVDLGVMGARAGRGRFLGATDSSSFSNAGLPSVYFDQDPIEYDTNTHHTNLDHYERVIEADARSSAAAIAALLYQLAMRDQMLPRFGKDDMPPPRTR